MAFNSTDIEGGVMGEVIDIEEAKKAKFSSCDKKITVQGPATVSCPEFIRSTCQYCGETIIALPATFDFEKVPPEFHAVFMNVLMQRLSNIANLAVHKQCAIKELEDSKKPKLVHSTTDDPSLLGRFFGWFKRFLFWDRQYGIRRFK